MRMAATFPRRVMPMRSWPKAARLMASERPARSSATLMELDVSVMLLHYSEMYKPTILVPLYI